MTRGLVVQAGDYLAWEEGPRVLPVTRTAYVERVATPDGQSRPRWWPGFRIVLRSHYGDVTTVAEPPRGAREATQDEVDEHERIQAVFSAPLPLDEPLIRTRVYAAPAEQAALF